MGRLSCSASWCGFHFAPDEKHWDAEQYDHEAPKRLGSRLIGDQQNHCDRQCENDVQSRQYWVADHLVRTLGIGAQFAQPNSPIVVSA